jgi:hypothetical protein
MRLTGLQVGSDGYGTEPACAAVLSKHRGLRYTTNEEPRTGLLAVSFLSFSINS